MHAAFIIRFYFLDMTEKVTLVTTPHGQASDPDDVLLDALSQGVKEARDRRTGIWTMGSTTVAALVWYFSSNFRNTGTGEIVVLVIAFCAGVAYQPLKRKITFMKYNSSRALIAGATLVAVSAFAIGFLIPLVKSLTTK
jgi:hypothetical protein